MPFTFGKRALQNRQIQLRTTSLHHDAQILSLVEVDARRSSAFRQKFVLRCRKLLLLAHDLGLMRSLFSPVNRDSVASVIELSLRFKLFL